MLFLMPANRYASIDVRLKPQLKRYSMPNWCRLVILFQVALVYFYASLAKVYPGWMDGTFTGILMAQHRNPVHAFITQQHWFHLFLAWGGLLFDLLIVPVLLYKRTRLLGTVAMLGFHFFNFLSLTIGIFPFLSLSMLLFFYPPDVVRQRLLPKKPPVPENEQNLEFRVNTGIIKYILIPYAIIQLALPLRHYFIPGSVFYTEEGHRLSWRMKLYHKSGKVIFYAQKKGSIAKEKIDLSKYFLKWQYVRIVNHPDMLWQAAQYIKEDYAKKGMDVEVYVDSKISFNRGPRRQLTDPNVDLTSVKWLHFSHSPWVLINDE